MKFSFIKTDGETLIKELLNIFFDNYIKENKDGTNTWDI